MIDELEEAIVFAGLDEELREGLPVGGAAGEIDGGDSGGGGLGVCGWGRIGWWYNHC